MIEEGRANRGGGGGGGKSWENKETKNIFRARRWAPLGKNEKYRGEKQKLA